MDISNHPGLQDISVLAKLPIKKLDLSRTAVRNLVHLKDLPLDVLIARHTFVSEMLNVRKLALVELDIRDSHVTKVSDLNLSRLKRIYVNKFVQNIAYVRK